MLERVRDLRRSSYHFLFSYLLPDPLSQVMQIEQNFLSKWKRVWFDIIFWRRKKWETLLIGTKKDFSSYFFLDPSTNTDTVLREATLRIHAKYDFFETTLQIEVYDHEMEDCKKCSNP